MKSRQYILPFLLKPSNNTITCFIACFNTSYITYCLCLGTCGKSWKVTMPYPLNPNYTTMTCVLLRANISFLFVASAFNLVNGVLGSHMSVPSNSSSSNRVGTFYITCSVVEFIVYKCWRNPLT